MTEEGLRQRTQTQERDSGDEEIPDVSNDDDHELFEVYIEIGDIQWETTRTQKSLVIKLHTHLDE